MRLLSFVLMLMLAGRTADAAIQPDSIPTRKPKRAVLSQQAPPPIIMPGTHLDTSFRSLARQDPAVKRAAPAWLRARTKGEPTYILDGNVATVYQIKRLKQADVASITTLDGEKATVLYGPNAKRGLLLITTKAGL